MTDAMPKPQHPFKRMSTVAKYPSAPWQHRGGKPKPTAAWKAEQRLLKRQYVADVKAYHLAMKAWRAAQK